ncbi:enoyl-CoA hydratase/isomerase family protein [Cereibacter sp. SYSU M97828]|nr:enoyl-CoA hydratase/isomerase family protein [Cereibacter flavus]
MSAPVAEDEVVLAVRGRVGVISLNRPKALNAINLGMVRQIAAALDLWEHDQKIDAILIKSTSGRAFCAGGDVRAIGILPTAEARVAKGSDFFGEEFTLNRRINRLAKPYISLIGGIAMGGGLGLTVHGSHRIVGDDVRMAMPETVLGYFPDIGATWFLNRCPGALGRYLALVGPQIGAADAVFSGLATHHVPTAAFDEIVQALVSAPALDAAKVDAIVSEYATKPQGGHFAERQGVVDALFGQDDLEKVVEAVGQAGADTPWVEEAAKALGRAAPMSLRATWHRMLEGRGKSVEDVLIDDYRMALRMIARDDFAEGVRAILVDKDQNPKWSPSALSQTSVADVEALLRPLVEDAARGDLVFG